MLLISGFALLYTAVVVPAQIFIWDYANPCNTFPTLYFDILVDIFFIVSCFFQYLCCLPFVVRV